MKKSCSRRSVFLSPAAAFGVIVCAPALASIDALAADLDFSTTASGLQWADAKVGNGPTKKKGDQVAIDYVMSTTGARYGTKIYSNKDSGVPYRWTLGDGSTIKGVEEAILGSSGMSPMMPGGVRRIIVPSALAYASLAKPVEGKSTKDDCQSGVGPVPPIAEGLGEFQRFKNIYCNPNLPYQPDLVMDIKMYGKRTVAE